MSLGSSTALRMAASVISWNTMRLTFTFVGGESSSRRCQAIASPSLSSSVARYTVSTLLASFLRLLMCLRLSLSTT